MKKIYASFFTILFSLAAFGQQIDNGSMENWDNLGSNDSSIFWYPRAMRKNKAQKAKEK